MSHKPPVEMATERRETVCPATPILLYVAAFVLLGAGVTIASLFAIAIMNIG